MAESIENPFKNLFIQNTTETEVAAVSFKNSLLDIEFDLTQNVVSEEEELTYFEKQICTKSIMLWRKNISDQILNSPATIDSVFFPHSEYKFDDWFRTGKTELLEKIQTEVSENFYEPLKLMIPTIGNEIFKFTEVFCKTNCSLSKETLFYFLNGLYLTRRGTIDYIRTATRLLEGPYLKQKDKYAIACYFCMEGKMSEFIKSFRSECGNRFIDNEGNRLMIFWTFHLNGRDSEFNKHISKCLIRSEANNEHLLFWAIRNENEVAVHYIWENFSDDELKKKTFDFVRYSLWYESTNIMCYLISQINQKDELEALCQEHAHTILSKLSNLRWRKYYRNASDYVLTLVRKMTFLNAIKTVVVLWLDRYEKEELRVLLTEFGVKFQVNIKIDFIFNNKTILKILLFVNNENIMKILLNVVSQNDLKTLFIIDNVIMRLGKQLVDCKKMKLFEVFIREVLINEKEIEAFKHKFMKKYS